MGLHALRIRREEVPAWNLDQCEHCLRQMLPTIRSRRTGCSPGCILRMRAGAGRETLRTCEVGNSTRLG